MRPMSFAQHKTCENTSLHDTSVETAGTGNGCALIITRPVREAKTEI